MIVIVKDQAKKRRPVAHGKSQIDLAFDPMDGILDELLMDYLRQLVAKQKIFMNFATGPSLLSIDSINLQDIVFVDTK